MKWQQDTHRNFNPQSDKKNYSVNVEKTNILSISFYLARNEQYSATFSLERTNF